MSESNYLAVNKESWNKRVDLHIDSDFYNNASFKEGASSLNRIELDILGDIAGKTALHLQCHFGQDTISLARMGAKSVGIDLSDKAINKAQEMAAQLGIDAKFEACDVYSTPQHITEQFDIVFTSYGTIGWLPDIDLWAEVIFKMLKPGGRLVFVEFHPVVWMFDDAFENVHYRYFKDAAIVETNDASYAGPKATVAFSSISWNHSLSEVIGSLRKQGLTINRFEEYDYSPYDCFSGTEEIAPGKFQIAKFGNKIPMVYAIEAFK